MVGIGMRSNLVHANGRFHLVLLLAVLILLWRDLQHAPATPADSCSTAWASVTFRGAGVRFHRFQIGERAGQVVRAVFPELAPRLPQECRERVVDPCTEIRLVASGTGPELTCRFSPLAETCRYLLARPMDINRANQEELRLLPGIGDRLAARIVRERTSRGGFGRVEDLLAVPGIGGKVLAGMQERIEVRRTARP